MKYNLSKIMKEAWKHIHDGKGKSEAMKQAWKDAKYNLSYWKWKPFLDHKRDIFACIFSLEPCDVENDMYLWFCAIMKKYNAKKGCVYTFLKNQIRGFETKLRREKEKNQKHIVSYEFQQVDSQREKFEDIISFYLTVDQELSDNAKQVLQFIFESEWSPRKSKDPSRKVCKSAVIRYFNKLQGWTIRSTKKAWEEIQVWWKEFQYA